MADPLQPGAVFAGHRIEGLAGRGGMGVVYKATHIALDHVVALKVISPALAQDERFRRRFGEESRIAVSIRHPNVVAIHHAGEEDGLLFVTMDLIDGTDLRGLLTVKGAMDPVHAAAVIAEVASALDAAHARGLVHRDIKPGNILIEGEGATERVYLTDFGLARLVEASTGVTATGAFVGTLDYVAPEQIRGERVDARADVYALGCVLFELLTGNPPFAARDDKVAKMYAHLQEEPPRVRLLRPELPGELDLVVGRALAKDPEERYPSAGDFARAVSRRGPGPGHGRGRAQRRDRRRRPRAAGGDDERRAARADDDRGRGGSPGDRGRLRPPAAPSRAPTVPRTARAAQPGAAGAVRCSPSAPQLVAAVVVGAILLSGGDDDGDADDQHGLMARPDDRRWSRDDERRRPTPKIDGDPVPVGDLPVNLVHGRRGLWVTNRTGDSVSFVDGDPATRLRPVPRRAEARGGRGRATARSGSAPTASRRSCGSTPTTARVHGSDRGRRAAGQRRLRGRFGLGRQRRREHGLQGRPATAARSATIEVGASSVRARDRATAASGSPTGGDDTIQRINTENGNPDATDSSGRQPEGDRRRRRRHEWVANSDDGTVSRVVNGVAQEPIEVGSRAARRRGRIRLGLGGGRRRRHGGQDRSRDRQGRRRRSASVTARRGSPSARRASGSPTGQDDTLTRIDP